MKTIITVERGKWRKAPTFCGTNIFAIGDIHGRADLLGHLHDEIRAVIKEERLDQGMIVHLGDYVDRGPEPLRALSMALDGLNIPGFEDVALPGNHEQFMINVMAAIERGSDGYIQMLDHWLSHGARAIGYELDIEEPIHEAERFRVAILERIGMDRYKKLIALPNHVRSSKYLFVHAGLNPVMGLSMLDWPWHLEHPDGDQDPLWIRETFLNYEGEHDEDVTVIHGHTPTADVVYKSNRIGIDTAAYSSGRLTALQLSAYQCRQIQTRERWANPVTSLFSAFA